MDNNGIIIPHPHSHPPGMRLFPRICLNAAAGTLKMIIYLLNVGDTRGEQCSPLIGPVSPHSASDWPEATQLRGHQPWRLGTGRSVVILMLYCPPRCQGSPSVPGILASHWPASHHPWPLIGRWPDACQ